MFIVLILPVYVLLSIYLGKRLRSLWGLQNLYKRKVLYWIIISIGIALLCLLCTAAIGFLLYLCLYYAASDILGWILKKIKPNINMVWKKIYCRGLLVFILSTVTCTYGYVNTKNIRVKEYMVDVKAYTKQEPLRILLISDMHMGTAVGKNQIDWLIEQANELKPDLICLDGDIYDENSEPELMEYSYHAFTQLSAKYGVFCVLGNHENYSDNTKNVRKRLSECGITVLQDESILIDNSFYLIGRKDASVHMAKSTRASMKELMSSLDTTCLVIVMDHQPIGMKESKQAGVDIVLCGHTHAGQIFPINLLARITNERHYGLDIEDDFITVTSSGMGTWGFPFRIGSHSEIVLITIN